MNIALITIGDELLSGNTQDTNSRWLGKYLKSKGLVLQSSLMIGDSLNQISRALNSTLDHNDVVILTGGLGPTKDDLTKSSLAKFFEKDLKFSSEVIELLEKHYAYYGKNWHEIKSSIKPKSPEQDYEFIPEDFKPLLNPNGLAPGLFFKFNDRLIFACPGVPREFESMFSQTCFPIIEKEFKIKTENRKTIIIRTKEIAEEKIFYSLDKNLWQQLEGFGKVASLPHYLGVDIIIEPNHDNKLSKENIEQEIKKIVSASPLNEYVWHWGDESLEEVIVKKAKDKNITFGFAESCTGGLLANLITNVSGSSAVFFGSIISYDNTVKEKTLKVSSKSLNEFGAVSKEVAKEMAMGAREELAVNIVVSTSGIAGPGGGSKEKPVGLVAIGFSQSRTSASETFIFKGDRKLLKKKFARKALYTLLDQIDQF